MAAARIPQTSRRRVEALSSPSACAQVFAQQEAIESATRLNALRYITRDALSALAERVEQQVARGSLSRRMRLQHVRELPSSLASAQPLIAPMPVCAAGGNDARSRRGTARGRGHG